MNCLITGASVGIGRALATRLASLNYNLYLTYFNNYAEITTLKSVLETKYSVKCCIKKLDLANEDNIKEVITDFQEQLGTLDLLINNAATYDDARFQDKTKVSFLKTLEVNIVGTFLMSKYAIFNMKKNGIIINMASTDGIDTYNLYNTDYAVSKAGIIQLTKSMALSYPELKIIAIAPNWVDTESTRLVSKEFLDSELKRINQKELIKVDTVISIIIEAIKDSKIKSGEVIRIDENK